METTEKKDRFGFRKSAVVGLTGALIGSSILFAPMASKPVKAATTPVPDKESDDSKATGQKAAAEELENLPTDPDSEKSTKPEEQKLAVKFVYNGKTLGTDSFYAKPSNLAKLISSAIPDGYKLADNYNLDSELAKADSSISVQLAPVSSKNSNNAESGQKGVNSSTSDLNDAAQAANELTNLPTNPDNGQPKAKTAQEAAQDAADGKDSGIKPGSDTQHNSAIKDDTKALGNLGDFTNLPTGSKKDSVNEIDQSLAENNAENRSAEEKADALKDNTNSNSFNTLDLAKANSDTNAADNDTNANKTNVLNTVSNRNKIIRRLAKQLNDAQKNTQTVNTARLNINNQLQNSNLIHASSFTNSLAVNTGDEDDEQKRVGFTITNPTTTIDTARHMTTLHAHMHIEFPDLWAQQYDNSSNDATIAYFQMMPKSVTNDDPDSPHAFFFGYQMNQNPSIIVDGHEIGYMDQHSGWNMVYMHLNPQAIDQYFKYSSIDADVAVEFRSGGGLFSTDPYYYNSSFEYQNGPVKASYTYCDTGKTTQLDSGSMQGEYKYMPSKSAPQYADSADSSLSYDSDYTGLDGNPIQIKSDLSNLEDAVKNPMINGLELTIPIYSTPFHSLAETPDASYKWTMPVAMAEAARTMNDGKALTDDTVAALVKKAYGDTFLSKREWGPIKDVDPSKPFIDANGKKLYTANTEHDISAYWRDDPSFKRFSVTVDHQDHNGNRTFTIHLNNYLGDQLYVPSNGNPAKIEVPVQVDSDLAIKNALPQIKQAFKDGKTSITMPVIGNLIDNNDTYAYNRLFDTSPFVELNDGRKYRSHDRYGHSYGSSFNTITFNLDQSDFNGSAIGWPGKSHLIFRDDATGKDVYTQEVDGTVGTKPGIVDQNAAKKFLNDSGYIMDKGYTIPEMIIMTDTVTPDVVVPVHAPFEARDVDIKFIDDDAEDINNSEVVSLEQHYNDTYGIDGVTGKPGYSIPTVDFDSLLNGTQYQLASNDPAVVNKWAYDSGLDSKVNTNSDGKIISMNLGDSRQQTGLGTTTVEIHLKHKTNDTTETVQRTYRLIERLPGGVNKVILTWKPVLTRTKKVDVITGETTATPWVFNHVNKESDGTLTPEDGAVLGDGYVTKGSEDLYYIASDMGPKIDYLAHYKTIIHDPRDSDSNSIFEINDETRNPARTGRVYLEMNTNGITADANDLPASQDFYIDYEPEVVQNTLKVVDDDNGGSVLGTYNLPTTYDAKTITGNLSDYSNYDISHADYLNEAGNNLELNGHITHDGVYQGSGNGLLDFKFDIANRTFSASFGPNFDEDSINSTIVIHLTHKKQITTDTIAREYKVVERMPNGKYGNDKTVLDWKPSFKRTVTKDLVTGQTSYGDWIGDDGTVYKSTDQKYALIRHSPSFDIDSIANYKLTSEYNQDNPGHIYYGNEVTFAYPDNLKSPLAGLETDSKAKANESGYAGWVSGKGCNNMLDIAMRYDNFANLAPSQTIYIDYAPQDLKRTIQFVTADGQIHGSQVVNGKTDQTITLDHLNIPSGYHVFPAYKDGYVNDSSEMYSYTNDNGTFTDTDYSFHTNKNAVVGLSNIMHANADYSTLQNEAEEKPVLKLLIQTDEHPSLTIHYIDQETGKDVQQQVADYNKPGCDMLSASITAPHGYIITTDNISSTKIEDLIKTGIIGVRDVDYDSIINPSFVNSTGKELFDSAFGSFTRHDNTTGYFGLNTEMYGHIVLDAYIKVDHKIDKGTQKETKQRHFSVKLPDGTLRSNVYTQSVELSRDYSTDEVTGETTYGEWTSGQYNGGSYKYKPESSSIGYSIDPKTNDVTFTGPYDSPAYEVYVKYGNDAEQLTSSISSEGVTHDTPADENVLIEIKYGKESRPVQYIDIDTKQVVGQTAVNGHEGQNITVDDTNDYDHDLYERVDKGPIVVPLKQADNNNPYIVYVRAKRIFISHKQPHNSGEEIGGNFQNFFYPDGVTDTDLNQHVVRTINVFLPNKPVETIKQDSHWFQDAYYTPATGELEYGYMDDSGNWHKDEWGCDNGEWAAYDAPQRPGLTPDIPHVNSVVTGNTAEGATVDNTTVDIHYRQGDDWALIAFDDSDNSNNEVARYVVRGNNGDMVKAGIRSYLAANLPNYELVDSEENLKTVNNADKNGIPISDLTPDTVIYIRHRTQELPIDEIHDTKRTFTRTIHMVTPDGKTGEFIQTVTFTRKATQDLVSGNIQYDKWIADGSDSGFGSVFPYIGHSAADIHTGNAREDASAYFDALTVDHVPGYDTNLQTVDDEGNVTNYTDQIPATYIDANGSSLDIYISYTKRPRSMQYMYVDQDKYDADRAKGMSIDEAIQDAKVDGQFAVGGHTDETVTVDATDDLPMDYDIIYSSDRSYTGSKADAEEIDASTNYRDPSFQGNYFDYTFDRRDDQDPQLVIFVKYVGHKLFASGSNSAVKPEHKDAVKPVNFEVRVLATDGKKKVEVEAQKISTNTSQVNRFEAPNDEKIQALKKAGAKVLDDEYSPLINHQAQSDWNGKIYDIVYKVDKLPDTNGELDSTTIALAAIALNA